MDENLKEVKQLLTSLDARIRRIESMVLVESGPKQKKAQKQKKLSVKEFLRSKKPNSDVQKTLAIGYYLEKHEKMSSFNVDDLRKAFKAAKESKPSNIHAFINQNIFNGHIMDYDEKKDNKKAFVLTASGERFVENNFKKKNEV